MHDFPSHLDEFTRRTDSRFGSSTRLARNATLFPLFSPFVDSSRMRSALTAMRGYSVARLKFGLGLPASRVSGRFPPRACRICMHADEETIGETY